jgi:hypothetical protein
MLTNSFSNPNTYIIGRQTWQIYNILWSKNSSGILQKKKDEILTKGRPITTSISNLFCPAHRG